MNPPTGLESDVELALLRRAQQQLRESEERYRLIVESAFDAIITIDHRGAITEFNPAAEAIFGYKRAQVIGRDLADTIIPMALRAGHRDGLARHRNSEHAPRLGVRLELPALRADGSEFPIELTVSRVAGGGSPKFTAIIRDITENRRYQEEIVRLNAELEERVRLRTAQLEAANAELVAFSYSIAHDLRSPLTSIDGFSQTLEQACGQAVGEQGRHYLRRIRAGIRQMSEITDAMLALAQLSRVKIRSEPVDLAAIARSAVAQLREEEPLRDAWIELPSRLEAQGDPRLLARVMANLVGNAWKFSSLKPSIQIRIGSAPGTNGVPVYFVADRGAGFDMAHAKRLFGAFERLHAPSEFEGTGIGLALVQKIVSRHGGRIWAEAAPGEGATFYFTLSGEPVS